MATEPTIGYDDLATLLDIYYDGTVDTDTPEVRTEMAKPPDERRTWGWRIRETRK